MLDRPIDFDRDTKDAKHRARLEAAVLAYRHPAGRDPLELRSAYGNMAAHWLRNAAGYLESRRDWTFAEKAAAFREFARRIQARSVEPISGTAVWRADEYVAKDGSVVFAGSDHRLVIRNRPGAPLLKGRVPDRERQRIARSGSPRRYYESWEPDENGESGLTSVRPDTDWEAKLQPQ